MREYAKNDEEDDGGGNPRPEFVRVHNLVAKETHEKCQDGDDDNACVAGYIGIYGVDELRTDNRVDARPSDAGKNVEECDYGSLASCATTNVSPEIVLIFTPCHPNQNRDSTICRKPNRGPKVEK